MATSARMACRRACSTTPAADSPRVRFRRREERAFRRFAVDAPPRSAYLLTGEIRHEWEHGIAPMEARRFSITFRNRSQA